MRTINILDFNGDGNGKKCNAVPLKNALDSIRAFDEESTLFFPKGEYHFYKENCPHRVVHTSNTNSCQYPDKTFGFLIENCQNLTVDGNGSIFIFHGNMQALTAINCKNVTFQNFTWDFAVPTTVELVTEKASKFFADFSIPGNFQWECNGKRITWFEESPLDGHRYWQFNNAKDCWCIVTYSPETENCCRQPLKLSPFFSARKVEKLSDNRIRIHYWKKTPKLFQKPGLVFEFCQNAKRECAGSFVWESSDVAMKNINVRYMNAFGFLIQMSRNVSFDNCNFTPDPESEKRCTSFADLIHVSGAAGLISIKNCNFSDAHDDPINIHGTFTRVVKQIDEKTLVLEYVHNQQGGFPQFHIGDKVTFFSRDMLQSIENNESLYTVASTVNPGESGISDKKMIVSFKETLPQNICDNIGKQKKYVAENVTYTPDVIISGCKMKSIPTRGILCTTRGKVIIENNTFDGMTMASIYLSNDSDEWYESGPIRDMTIRQNTFYICKSSQNEWSDKGAIFINPITKGGKLPSWETPIHKNITIDNNLFYMEHDKVIKAKSVENLTFTNNTVERYQRTEQDKEIIAFEFNACKNVVISQNKFAKTVVSKPVVSNMPLEQIHFEKN